jgi:hypothetical protein
MIGKRQFDDIKQAFRRLFSRAMFHEAQTSDVTSAASSESDVQLPKPLTGDEIIPLALAESGIGEGTAILSPWSDVRDMYAGTHSVLPSRKPRTSGPEHMLLQTFLEQFHFVVPAGYRVTLFREPRIESGFPDLVCVVWDARSHHLWNPKRALLRKQDLQLLHLLVSSGSYDAVDSGFFEQKRYAPSLRRLAEAEAIYRRGDAWLAQPLSSLFLITEIIAIEAKMRDWRQVVKQAQVNTWFASRSYILVPRPPAKSFLPEYAKNAGVGLITATDPERPLVEAERLSLPRSYASWIFNEWVAGHPNEW